MPDTFGIVSRRTLLGAGLGAALSWRAQAQGGGPIRIIFPFAPGGGGGGIARFLAEELRKATGETVIVENRAGADGRVGVRSVVTAPPDGRTILLTVIGTISIQPSLYRNLPYNPLTDLAPIAHIGTIEFAFSTGPMTGVRSLAELVAWLRANPEKASYASPGVGTLPHLLGLMFAAAAKIDLRHVPYRGTSPALTDLLGGQIALSSTTASEFGEHHKSGAIRMLATSGAKRSPFSPDVPTWREQGYDIEGEGWFGAYAPAGTPRAIIDRYAGIFSRAVQSSAGRDLLAAYRVPATGYPPEVLERVQTEDARRWAALIKSAGISIEE